MADPSGLIVLGGSAGCLAPLETILKGLPQDLPAAVLIVVHLSSYQPSRLAEVLQRSSRLPVSAGCDGERVEAGRVYVAIPNHHLMVDEDWKLAVTRGPRENRARPSVDALFRSAAYRCGPRTIGVILSGALDDGTAGLWALQRCGGVTLVQAPADADHPSMPESALAHVQVDHVLPATEIPGMLVELVKRPEVGEQAPAPELREALRIEDQIAAGQYPLDAGVLELGPPTHFTCPQCRGVLAELKGAPIKRYRCHTGHAYSARSFFEAALHESGKALDDARRALEEIMLSCDTMLSELAKGDQGEKLQEVRAEAEAGARAIRALLSRTEFG